MRGSRWSLIAHEGEIIIAAIITVSRRDDFSITLDCDTLSPIIRTLYIRNSYTITAESCIEITVGAVALDGDAVGFIIITAQTVAAT